MSIPEKQFETWSSQGAIAQSRDTYATVRGALTAPQVGYSGKSYSLFLQGSYGNDTNIYAESDVDVVILLDSTYYYDFDGVPDDQQNVFREAWEPATYSYGAFKADVYAALSGRFGGDVTIGNKALEVAASGGRRKADVIAAAEYRHYYAAPSVAPYIGAPAPLFHRGICFFTSGNEKIINYPKQHSANCTAKHQATRGWYKPMVRILKNVRNRAVRESLLSSGTAPSYFLEGLLYNLPNGQFGGSYAGSFVNLLNWMLTCNSDDLVCANERYYLVRDGAHNCWAWDDFDRFRRVLLDVWQGW